MRESFGSRVRKLADACAVRLAPLARLVPEKPRHAVRDALFRVTGVSRRRAPRRPPEPWQPGRDPAGINLFGFFRAENGLGEAVKAYARSAEAAGIPHSFLNTDLFRVTCCAGMVTHPSRFRSLSP